MLVEDELLDRTKNSCLTPVDFLEALVRLADAMHGINRDVWPPAEESFEARQLDSEHFTPFDNRRDSFFVVADLEACHAWRSWKYCVSKARPTCLHTGGAVFAERAVQIMDRCPDYDAVQVSYFPQGIALWVYRDLDTFPQVCI